MIRHPPISTRTDTRFASTTLFRSVHQRLRRGIECHRSFSETLCHFLAQLDPELVEGIDAEQHGIGEDAMLVESDQRAEAARADLVEQDGRDRKSTRLNSSH